MESQNEFTFALNETDGPSAARAEDPLIADISAVWRLPIGQKIKIQLRDQENLSEITGKLELTRAPELPFDPRETLQLRIRGYAFSSRAIVAWTLVE